MSTPTTFQAYEVAFRIPGESWKRRTIKTQAAEDRFFAMVDDEAAEVRWSDEHEQRIANDCATY